MIASQVRDKGAGLLRAATLLSVIGCYPLVFIGLRDACAPVLVRRTQLR